MAIDDWHERQYNTSCSVPDEDAVLTNWQVRAKATRAQIKFQHDIAYGTRPREILDFFPAKNAKGVLIFIHGGYWRGLSKIETSWVAEGFVELGISVALINYPLCPEVSIGDIRVSVQKTFVHLYRNVLNNAERAGIVVCGHSAGGYLAAFHLAADWTSFGLPQNPLAGVIAISGIYDVAPLMQTSMNADIRITLESALALNLMTTEIKSQAPFTLVVGGDEPSEFHIQAKKLAKAWKALCPIILTLPKKNHFTVVDSLADPLGEINQIARNILSHRD